MPRTRTISGTYGTKATSATRTTSTYNGITTSVQITPTSGTYRDNYFYKTMTDVVTPNFQRLLREGHIVNNDMTSVTHLGVVTPFLISYRAKWAQTNPPYTNPKWIIDAASGTLSTHTQGLGDAVSVLGTCAIPTLPSLDTGRAIAAAYSQMTRTPLNVWVSAVELEETVLTVVKTVAAINRLMRMRCKQKIDSSGKLIRMSRSLTLAQILHQIPQVWLHVRYGLRPLVYELIGALEVLRKLNLRIRERFSSQVFTETASASSGVYSKTYGTMTYKTQLTRRLERHTTGGLLAEVATDDLTLPHLLGMGNGLIALWDLVPYSFVIDWFANVADLMSVWNPSPYVNARATWVVSKEYLTSEHMVKPELGISFPVQYTYPLAESSGYAYGGVRYTVTTVKRIADPALPIVPTLQLNLSVSKGIDLLALSRSLKRLLV